MGSVVQDHLPGLSGTLIQVGVDEVGRGCLAGPVVACACFKTQGCELPKVYDSKSLTSKRREALFLELVHLENFYYAFGVIPPSVIDQVNILQATFMAMRQALIKLPLGEYEVLVDGSLVIPGVKYPQTAMIKGDAKEPLISAASILAKVFRDQLMELYSEKFPDYGFNLHKGYGTKAHLEALERLGPCTIHRLSFAPLSKGTDR